MIQAVVVTVVMVWSVITLNPAIATASNSLSSSLECRTILNYQELMCPADQFDDFACLSCYLFMPEHVIPESKKFRLCPNTKRNCTFTALCRPESHVNSSRPESHVNSSQPLPLEAYNYTDPRSEIYDTFENEADKAMWQICCESAAACCRSMIRKPNATAPGMCPRTWDGWQCFDDTPANETFEAPCPIYSYLRADVPACPVTFRRPCLSSSKWSTYLNSTLEWTNYSDCHASDVVQRRHYTHIGAYVVSLLALAPAIIIFFSYKQLRVPRITMHINLFISIFLNGVIFIIFKKLVILTSLESTDSLVRDNSPGCKFLFVLTKYLRSTNYMWMFCESFYLHRLIVAAFNEQKRLYMYYIIGWVFPVIPLIIYSILRLTNDKANKGCWLSPVNGYEWVFNAPLLISLMINFIFLCNIIRVLVSKLRATNSTEPSQYRKAVRATLVLVPLFGLHFGVTLWRPESGPCEWRESYYYINYLMDGLQGFLVALIFCYLNGEVHFLVNRSFERRRLRHNPQNYYNSTQSYATHVTSVSESPTHSKTSDKQSVELKEMCSDLVDS